MLERESAKERNVSYVYMIHVMQLAIHGYTTLRAARLARANNDPDGFTYTYMYKYIYCECVSPTHCILPGIHRKSRSHCHDAFRRSIFALRIIRSYSAVSDSHFNLFAVITFHNPAALNISKEKINVH